jgi:hypothetical protein
MLKTYPKKIEGLKAAFWIAWPVAVKRQVFAMPQTSTLQLTCHILDLGTFVKQLGERY